MGVCTISTADKRKATLPPPQVGGNLNLLSGAYAADSSQCGLFPLRVIDAILQALR